MQGAPLCTTKWCGGPRVGWFCGIPRWRVHRYASGEARVARGLWLKFFPWGGPRARANRRASEVGVREGAPTATALVATTPSRRTAACCGQAGRDRVGLGLNRGLGRGGHATHCGLGCFGEREPNLSPQTRLGAAPGTRSTRVPLEGWLRRRWCRLRAEEAEGSRTSRLRSGTGPRR